MNSELQQLYQEVILDHYKNPRNRGKISNPTAKAEGFNPLCGDQITVFIRVEKGIIQEIGFEGKGCAISMASASMMTEALKGKNQVEFEELFQNFHQFITEDFPETKRKDLGKLFAFGGVREFPMRVKCASLAWHTAKAATSGKNSTISTESV